MKTQSIRNGVCIALCCIAVMAFYSCQVDPDDVTTYSVKYDANGATGLTPPKDKNSYESGEKATVLDIPSDFVKDGMTYALCWNTLADASGTTYYPGDVITVKKDVMLYARWTGRKFTAANMADSTYYATIADLRATGTHCVVYAEGTAGVTDEVVQSVMKEFDEAIYPKITDVFGLPYDVGVTGKTLLLLLDIKDGFSGSGSYVAGYFDADMMRSKSEVSYSNEEDMLYLDTYPAKATSLSFKETAAHEFQHLINYSEHGIRKTGTQDVWLNEGLSAAAEYIYSGTESSDWVKYFNAGTGALKSGNNFFVWNGYWEDENANYVLDNYATAYLFFRWLGIQAGTGIGESNVPDNSIYTGIINSAKTDYSAVLEAVAADTEAKTITDGTWGILLRNWFLANYYHNATDDTFGYNGAIAITTAPIYAATTSVSAVAFSSGEAMFYPTDSSNSYAPPVSGSDIKYYGLTEGSVAIDSSPAYSGNHILVMNANPVFTADDENGYVYVASVARANYLRSVQTVEYEMPEIWAIDAGVLGAGGSRESRELTARALEASRGKARVAPSLRKAN
jgi:hypothetical protein